MDGDRVLEFLKGDRQATYHVEQGDLHAACLILAAKAQGIGVDTIPPFAAGGHRPWLRLDLPDKTAYFREGRLLVGGLGAEFSDCRLANRDVVPLIDDKRASKELFRILGLPAPVGQFFSREDEAAAVAWFHALGRPACVKANRLGYGNCVFPALADEDDVRHAFRAVAQCSTVILVEEHFHGAPVRFFYVRPRVVAVRIDRPANVVGDGRSSIADLIVAKNIEKRRRTGHIPIAIDDDVMRRLTRQGLGLDHVPEEGRQIFLRAVSNGYKGGDSIDCRAILHPSYAQAIERMCNAIRDLRISAVDTKVLDPTQPAAPDNFTILEANNRPGLVPFHFPWEGEPQDVSTPIVAALMREDWWTP